MIRNIVVGRLRPDVAPEAVDEALQALLDLRPEGLIETRAGRDAGLRAGNWGYAITADFVDEDAYRRYDLGDEHNRIRREMFDPISESIARVRFAVTPGPVDPKQPVRGRRGPDDVLAPSFPAVVGGLRPC